MNALLLDGVGGTRPLLALTASLDDSHRGFVAAGERAARFANVFSTVLTDLAVIAANNPVRVAGLEARHHVRGAIGVPDAAALDQLVTALTNGTHEDARWLTPAHRVLLAAAAVRGWVEHHPAPAPDALAWHRQLGDTAVEVGRG